MFYIGQELVCVKVPQGYNADCRLPAVGRVYTVRCIQDNEDGGGPCVLLNEIVNVESLCWLDDGRLCFGEPDFEVWNFRPLRTTNIDVFRAMLRPTFDRQEVS